MIEFCLDMLSKQDICCYVLLNGTDLSLSKFIV